MLARCWRCFTVISVGGRTAMPEHRRWWEDDRYVVAPCPECGAWWTTCYEPVTGGVFVLDL